MREALQQESITRSVLESVGQEHGVCPFELSLDVSSWVDAVVCDYNYVFDPKVYLRRHFGEQSRDYGFLVDEAHNLVDRAREMFSGELHSREVHEVRRAIKPALPRCAKTLTRLGSAMRKLGRTSALGSIEPTEAAQESDLFHREPTTAPLARGAKPLSLRDADVITSKELPAALLAPIDDFLAEAEVWLAQNQPAEFREALLELYFQLHSFRRTADGYDERYVTIIETRDGVRVRLFCLDPSYLLRQALDRGKAAVFFSATLAPIDYYRSLISNSSEDPLLQLSSPFAPENFAVLVQDRIRTHFKARGESLTEVAQAIGNLVQGRLGNYLVYFPSYQYLSEVQAQFQIHFPTVRLLAQRPAMSEAEREAFLGNFAVEHGETLAGFAVMGGIFGEGIDLVGDRLIGAVVVGVGLPQLCVERDLICQYFQERSGCGFDFAYTFPGMNRVLQSSGRVIRSENDRGVVLLIDSRFAESRYRRLFPEWWHPRFVRTAGEIREAAHSFWHS
jgi:DNA excision repair protein ERCC-2